MPKPKTKSPFKEAPFNAVGSNPPGVVKKGKKQLSPRDEGIKETGMAVTQHTNGLELTFDKALSTGKQLVADGLQLITATVAMKDLKPTELRDIFDYATGLNDAVDETRKLARARVLDYAITNGEKTGPTGMSRKLIFPDARELNVKVMKSGTDPKKFEGALRAKGKDVTKYMVQSITYRMPSDFDGPQRAIDDGVFSADEVASFSFDVTYAVERSKEGKGE